MRSANITERFINSLPVGKDPYEMIGNPLLKPEANNQADFLVSYRSAGTVVELSGFCSRVDHYISSAIVPEIAPKFGGPGVRQFINIDKANLCGFEFIWNQNWIPQLKNQLRIAYTYGQNASYKSPLPEICPMNIRFNIEGNFLENRMMPFIAVRHSMAQNRIDPGFGEVRAKAFTVVDTGISFLVLKRIQSSVAVNNLADRQYREHLSRFLTSGEPMNSVGRSLVVNLSYSF
jgi:iron complex outermembrane receptor protein